MQNYDFRPPSCDRKPGLGESAGSAPFLTGYDFLAMTAGMMDRQGAGL
jgi:hypothetical protein